MVTVSSPLKISAQLLLDTNECKGSNFLMAPVFLDVKVHWFLSFDVSWTNQPRTLNPLQLLADRISPTSN